MRFEVPQFIEVEAKIIGPLTWKQFIYITGGVGVIVVIYILTNFLITLLLGVPLAILAFSLAFHKINNRPLSIFLESAVNYVLKKRLYLWRRGESQTIIHKNEGPEPEQTLAYTNQKTISSLAHSLETHNTNQE